MHRALFFVGFVLLTPSVALAADQQQWWQVLLSELIKLAMLVVVPVLSTLASVLMHRWGLKVQTEQIEKLAAAAAGWAEQKAAKALKEGAPKARGAQKMKDALVFARENLAKYGLTKKAISKLEHLIEAHLGKEKIKAPAPKASEG